MKYTNKKVILNNPFLIFFIWNMTTGCATHFTKRKMRNKEKEPNQELRHRRQNLSEPVLSRPSNDNESQDGDNNLSDMENESQNEDNNPSIERLIFNLVIFKLKEENLNLQEYLNQEISENYRLQVKLQEKKEKCSRIKWKNAAYTTTFSVLVCWTIINALFWYSRC